MKFPNIFSKKNVANNNIAATSPVVEQTESKEAVNNVTNTEEQKPLTVSYATGWPIDIVYGYLHKDYESQGFEDAMVRSDMAFKTMNMNIIRNKILMVFREINLNYDVKKQDLQIRIDNCESAGLLTTATELDYRMQIINSHKTELEQLENDFRNNVNAASIPLQSYECGFLRGIATVALSMNKNSSMPNSQRELTTKAKAYA